MNGFLSISDATKIYKVSSNTLRKLVKDNLDSEHIKTVAIKSRHGFKYVVSISFLNSLYKTKTDSKQTANNDKTDLKQTTNFGSTNLDSDTKIGNTKQDSSTKNSSTKIGSNDNRFIKQLQETNKQQSDTITSQQTTIKDLTTTLQEQQKVVVAQSLQISRLSERTTTTESPQWNEPTAGPGNDNKKTTTIELTIIVVLVVCIVAAVYYLFK
jgi:uncharacterized coiled-coil protein SlyX